MSAPTHPVAVALVAIVDGDKVLMGRRDCGSEIHGKWEFPGGKLAHGEHPTQAARRELREEIGAEFERHKLSLIPMILSNVWESGLHVVITCYSLARFDLRSTFVGPRPGIHSALEWFSVDNVLAMERERDALPGSYEVALGAIAQETLS